ncbi:hypothetical protein BJQ90_04051 [Arthrobacter sp. SO3]|nr:hypothetical protein [Arthrobacter sp. SO3]
MTVTAQPDGWVKETWPSGNVNVSSTAAWGASGAGAASLGATGGVAVAVTRSTGAVLAGMAADGVVLDCGAVVACGAAQPVVSRSPARAAAASVEWMVLRFKCSPNKSVLMQRVRRCRADGFPTIKHA